MMETLEKIRKTEAVPLRTDTVDIFGEQISGLCYVLGIEANDHLLIESVKFKKTHIIHKKYLKEVE